MRQKLLFCFGVVCVALFSVLPLLGQTWRAIGPPGGDVRSLAADPSNPLRLYLGASDGHIFGSHDGGEHWRLLGRVGTRLDSIVSAIVVDPRSSERLYAGTWTLGPDGGGVFESDDSGRNWRALGLAGQSVRALVQAPSNPDILVAGTLSAVFRSRDAGRNWERISPDSHDYLRNFDSLAIDPHNPEVIYAGTYHLAWKTADGGRQWVPIHAGMVDDSDVMSISVDFTDPQRVYASACSGIYHSENGGALWAKFRGIPPTARRTHQIRQDPQHPQTLYSVTTEGLWKTLDGGATWSRITPATWSIAAMVIHPKNTNRLVVGVEGLGVYASDDGGRNFHAANEGFNHRQVIDLALDARHSERMLLVLTNSVEPVLASEDGGRTWVRLGPGLSTYKLRRAYAAPDGWWAALEGGGLLRYDTKNAWVKAGNVLDKQAPAQKRVAQPGSRKTIRPMHSVVNDMAFAHHLWLAATENGLLASRDRGTSWTSVPLGLTTELPVHSIRVSEDGNHIWAVSPHSLISSDDGGRTWASQELGLGSRGRLRLYHLNDNRLLVTGGIDAHVSDDAGKTWHPYNLRAPWIQDLAGVGNVLLVSTQKHGLHVSYDRGATWEHIEGPVADGYFPALASGGASAILAASRTEGLYALEISGGVRVSLSNAPAAGSSGLQPPPR